MRTIILVFVMLFSCHKLVLATSNDMDILQSTIREQLIALDLDQLTDFVERVDPDYREYIPELNWQTIVGQQQGKFNILTLLQSFVVRLFKEVIVNAKLMRQLLVIALLSAFFRQLDIAIETKGLINIAFMVCFLVVVFVGLQSFRSAIAIAYASLDDMVSFMYTLLPIMATLLASVGGISSAAIFHPILMAVVSGIAFLIRTVLFPLLNINAVVGLVSHLSADFPLSKLSGLLKHLSTMLLSFVFTIFLGVLAVRGAIAPVADGVALRAAKFLTSNIVPVIGSMFANAVEVVVGGSLLIKNTIGVFGMILIFFLVGLPIVKIWAIVLIYRIVAVLIEPLCDPRIGNAVSSLAGALTLIMVSLATVALMFFLSITILVGFGNLAALMR